MNQTSLLISLGAGALIPIVNGFFTKLTAPSWVKTILALVLAGVVAVLAWLQQACATSCLPLNWPALLTYFATAFIASATAYSHVYKTVPALTPATKIAPSFGIGPSTPAATATVAPRDPNLPPKATGPTPPAA